MVLNLERAPEPPGGLRKHRLLGPSSGVSHSVGTGRGLEISSKFPRDAGATGAGTTLWEALLVELDASLPS